MTWSRISWRRNTVEPCRGCSISSYFSRLASSNADRRSPGTSNSWQSADADSSPCRRIVGTEARSVTWNSTGWRSAKLATLTVRYPLKPRIATNFARTSPRMAAGTRQLSETTGRDIVSMLRTCPVKISPAIGKPGGNTTLVPNGLTRVVIGQTMVKRLACQNATGEMTSAGRLPPCSRPVLGSQSVQIRSPSSGSNASFVNDFAPDVGSPIEQFVHGARRHSDQQIGQPIVRAP